MLAAFGFLGACPTRSERFITLQAISSSCPRLPGSNWGLTMASATYRELLGRNKSFRLLWIGQVISELGTWFSFVAEIGLVRMFSGSAMATTALLVAKLLPFLLVAPIAGVLADRRSRKKLLIYTDLIRAALALVFIVAGKTGAVWLIIATSASMSSLTMFFEAAKNAAIPNLVSGRELLTANVLMFSTRFLQYTLGSALGGVTAVQFGYDVAFVTNAASFVASALFIVPIPGRLMRKLTSEAGSTGAEAEIEVSVAVSNPMSAETEGGLPIGGSEEPAKSGGVRFWSDIVEGIRFIWA